MATPGHLYSHTRNNNKASVPVLSLSKDNPKQAKITQNNPEQPSQHPTLHDNTEFYKTTYNITQTKLKHMKTAQYNQKLHCLTTQSKKTKTGQASIQFNNPKTTKITSQHGKYYGTNHKNPETPARRGLVGRRGVSPGLIQPIPPVSQSRWHRYPGHN